MRRYRSHDQPRLFWAKFSLALGVLSLIPLLGAPLALLALTAAATGGILNARRPSKYGGRPLLWTGVALAMVGLLASTGEAALFLKWKRTQAAGQKARLSSERLMEWASAVENYRIDSGFYPEVTETLELERELIPVYAPSLPKEDAWGRRFAYESDGRTCSVSAVPASAPDGAANLAAPLPTLKYVGTFPAMPPPPPAIGPPAPWPPTPAEAAVAIP